MEDSFDIVMKLGQMNLTDCLFLGQRLVLNWQLMGSPSTLSEAAKVEQLKRLYRIQQGQIRVNWRFKIAGLNKKKRKSSYLHCVIEGYAASKVDRKSAILVVKSVLNRASFC